MSNRRVIPDFKEPNTPTGVLYMVGSCVAFATLWALLRYASQELHFTLLVFFRNLFGLIVLLGIALPGGFRDLKIHRFKWHGVRALSGLAATFSTFFAVVTIPLADVVAITYAAPLFATIAAVLMLGEKVRARRISALLIGFAGMLLVLRPGEGAATFGHLVAVVAAIATAVTLITIKHMTASETPRSIVVYPFLIMMPISFFIALPFWTWPSAETLALLVVIGIIASIGQTFLARAFAAAEATAVLPFDFVRLVLATALGYLLFAERIDVWTISGAVVILASTVYLAHREARVAAREARPPAF